MRLDLYFGANIFFSAYVEVDSGKDFFENYTRILVERFPEKQDEVDQLNELENGAEHPQERR